MPVFERLFNVHIAFIYFDYCFIVNFVVNRVHIWNVLLLPLFILNN